MGGIQSYLRKNAINTVISDPLWANSADDKLVVFFLFFWENMLWHFMQIVSLGDNLHEMPKPIFSEK